MTSLSYVIGFIPQPLSGLNRTLYSFYGRRCTIILLTLLLCYWKVYTKYIIVKKKYYILLHNFRSQFSVQIKWYVYYEQIINSLFIYHAISIRKNWVYWVSCFWNFGCCIKAWVLEHKSPRGGFMHTQFSRVNIW